MATVRHSDGRTEVNTGGPDGKRDPEAARLRAAAALLKKKKAEREAAAAIQLLRIKK